MKEVYKIILILIVTIILGGCQFQDMIDEYKDSVFFSPIIETKNQTPQYTKGNHNYGKWEW